MRITSLAFLLALTVFALNGQPLQERYAAIGEVVVLQLSSAPFPHAKRDTGHVYDGKKYSAEEHYRDSTVGVFIPKGYRKDKPIDVVVHIHGWFNSVDSVFVQFKLAEQLYESGRNAILIVPEGPKNAPDSFGGKLEEEGAFKEFISEILFELRKRGTIRSTNVRSIIVSGHSGAYRMISFILMRGGMTEKIKEVYLFDALYGNVEKYAHWLDHSRARLVAIYTDGGGTRGTTEVLMEDLTAWKIPFAHFQEMGMGESNTTIDDPTLPLLSPRGLQENRVVFIHTDLEHNDVLNARQEFRMYLETGKLEKR